MSLQLKSLSAGIAGTIFRQTLAMMLALLLSIYFARVLGPTGNGLYALLLLVPTIIAKFTDLGFSSANIHFLGSQQFNLRTVFWTTALIGFLASVIGVIVSVVITSLLYGEHEAIGKNALVFGTALLIPALNFQSYTGSMLLGLQQIRKYNLVQIAGPLLTLILAVVLISIIGLDVGGAVLARFFGVFLQVVVALIFLIPTIVATSRPLERLEYARTGLSFGWLAQFSIVTAFLNYRFDLLMVNFFLGPAETGIYLVSVQLVERLWVLTQAVNTVLFPRLSSMSGDEINRKRLTPLVAHTVLIVVLLAAIMMALIGRPAINILYGEAYVRAYVSLLLLLPGTLALSVSKILSVDLSSRGRPGLNALTGIGVLVINIIANYMLIPRFGIGGAALASSVSYSVTGVVKLIQYARVSGNRWWHPIWLSPSDRKFMIQGLNKVRQSLGVVR